MSSLFISIDKWKRQPVAVIAIYLAWCAIAYIALHVCWVNYLTSVDGYNMLPINTVVDISYLVGALPIFVQWAAGAMAIEKKNKVAGLFCFVCFVIDVSTCMMSLAVDDSLVSILFAFVVSVGIFTVCSELLLIMAFENIAGNLPDFIASILVIIGRAVHAVGLVVDWFTTNDDVTYTSKAKSRKDQRRLPG